MKYNIILQSKGGVGKSYLTYNFSLLYEKDESIFFLDADASTKTSSTTLLKHLHGKNPARVGSINWISQNLKIDRQLMLSDLEEYSKTNYKTIIMDMGSTESQEFLNLIKNDYTLDEFKGFETYLQSTFVFNIVISGGAAYKPSTAYMNEIVNILKGQFEIVLFINENTFENQKELIEEIKNYAQLKKGFIKTIKYFGGMDISSNPIRRIMGFMNQGLGLDAYPHIERLNINKELAKLK